MPRILFLTQVLPYPLDAGPKVRAYYMLRYLGERHEVTLVSFVRPDDRPEYVEHLAGLCHALHTVPMVRSTFRNVRAGFKALATRLPIAVTRDQIDAMGDLLRRLVAATPFDVIHADQLSMAGYGQLAARAATFSIPHSSFTTHDSSSRPPATLLDEHNAYYLLAERIADEASGLRRLAWRREAAAFRRYETAMCRAYDAVLSVTAEDRRRLLALYPPQQRAALAERFTVVPICVDPARVPPAWPQEAMNEERGVMNADPEIASSPFIIQNSSFRAPTILHLGTMFWPPNVAGVLWFAREVLPSIWARLPEARFVVVGKNPPAEVQALAEDPRVEVAGYVADPLPYLQAADAFVVPLFSGGGMRVKILDGWLWGLPLVSTPIGAEGIELRDGENILIAGDPAGFAAATLRLLTDPDLNRRLRVEGRRWVEATYAWQVVYQRVDEVYARLLAQRENAGAHPTRT